MHFTIIIPTQIVISTTIGKDFYWVDEKYNCKIMYYLLYSKCKLNS